MTDSPRTERRANGPASAPDASHWIPQRASLEHPLTWALPIAKVAGVTVKVHSIFLLFAIVIVVKAAIGAPSAGALTSSGWGIVALLVGLLFVVVVAHEFGHCIACRLTGGVADEVLLWPLGGLAACRAPRGWRAQLVTALAGPAVNAAICIVASIALGLSTGSWIGFALPNPLSFDAFLFRHGLGAADLSWTLLALFIINWTSLVVLLFNLVPAFPLDGARVLHAALWPRLGEVRALRVTIAVGYVAATGVGICGAVLGNWILLGVALLGGFTCHRTYRQLEFTEAEVAADLPEAPAGGAVAALAPGAERTAIEDVVEDLQAQREDERLREEVDEILGIIAVSGMESLTPRQRKVLERETARRRAADAADDDG